MKSDVKVGLFSLFFSILYTISSWNLPDAAIGSPMAPKYFPLVIGLLATIFSIMLIAKGLKSTTPDKKGKAPDKGRWVLIGGLRACCLVYAALLERIGFLASTVIFLGGMLFLVNGVKGWKANIITAFCFSFGVWYIFQKIFMISLP